MKGLIKNFYFFTLLVLSLAITLNSQTEYLESERISIAHGLSSNGIWSILQDSKGFLWIGTDTGLNRYDGYNFKIYKNEPDDSTSISSNGIESIYEDRSGKLWIGTRSGLNQYNPYSDSFIRYVNDPYDSNSLTANHVSTIYQDNSGCLWVVVWGINNQARINKLELFDSIYDGSLNDNKVKPTFKFTSFRLNNNTKNFNKNSDQDTSVVEKSGDALWIGTRNKGLIKFTTQTGLVEHYQHDPNNPNSIAGNRVGPVTIDSLGFIWIGISDAGIDRLNPETGKIIHFKHDPSHTGSIPDNKIQFLYTDPGGIIWIGAGTIVSGYDSQMNLISRFSVSKKPNVNSFSSDAIGFIFQDHSHILWLGTGNNGLVKVNRRPQTFVHYQHNPNDPNSLFTNDIKSLYKDRSGNIWITTYGSGLSCFNPDTETFKHFQHDSQDPSSLGHNYVTSFCEDNLGHIWLGTWAGISRFNPESETFSHFMKFHPDAKEPKSGSIKRIYKDRSGNLWFGTYDGGLYELIFSTTKTKSLDQRNGQSEYFSTIEFLPKSISIYKEFDPVFKRQQKFYVYKHISGDLTSISDNSIRRINQDKKGNIWVTTSNGINLQNRQSLTFRNITQEAGLSEFYGPYDRQRFYEDSDGKLWLFSTTLGLCRIDLSNEKSERFKIIPHTLPDDAFTQYNFYESSEEIISDNSKERNIWIASKYGLLKLDPKAEVFTAHYTQNDGLPGNTVDHIVSDNLGKLWLLSYKGLTLFDEGALPGEQFYHFSSKDGVVNSQRGNHIESDSGEIYWGGSNGLYRFSPEHVKNNPHVPQIVLTELRIFNKIAKLDTTITYLKHLTLAHNKNSFSFSFAALDYSRPHLNQYSYILDGFDESWNFNGNINTANYTNIPPGNYLFRVKGSNDGDLWNEQGASIRVIITPPWWSSNWAYTFYFMLIVLTFYGWRRFDIRRTELKNELKLKEFESEKLKEVDHLKSRFFANISHEFRTPLTLIIEPLREMVSGKFKENLKGQYDIMLRNSKRLLRLVNQLLDLSKLESGMMTLKAEEYELIPFLKGVVSSFESQATHQKLRLRFIDETEKGDDHSPLLIYFDQEKLEQIIFNLLANSFKFTPEQGDVSVRVGFGKLINSNKAIYITFKDTGIGIPEDRLPFVFNRFYQLDTSDTRKHEGTGIGLALTKELVELHHGEISVTSQIGIGTEFTIRLPMGRDHLNHGEIKGKIEITEPQKPSRIQVEHQFTTDQKEEKYSDTREYVNPSKGKQKKELIIVVDDNADVRSYIRQHLQPLYEVVEARDGAEGVAISIETIPDLIISDVMMPKMDGYELCRILKKDIKTSHIPVILLTAKASEEHKIEGLETGADDYLIKPFNSNELQVRIKNLVDLRRKLQDKYHKDFLLKPSKVTVESMENEFLRHACVKVEQHLADPEFNIEQFAEELFMTRANLHRKLRALTDQSPSQFTRSIRLKHAAQLLKQHGATITEIAYDVGFSSSAYFSKCFKEQYGLSPQKYKDIS